MLSMSLVPHDQPAEVVEPGEEAFHLPSSLIPPELSAILGRRACTPSTVRRDDLHPVLPQHMGVKWVAVVRLIADQALPVPSTLRGCSRRG